MGLEIKFSEWVILVFLRVGIERIGVVRMVISLWFNFLKVSI